MPSQQDVRLKEIDALRGYNVKFGTFLEIMSLELKKIPEKLQEISRNVDKKSNAAQEQYEQVHMEAKAARNEWYALNAERERDPVAILNCRRKLDHVEGHVTPMMRGYADLAQTFSSSAQRDIDQIIEMTEKYRNRLTVMVENGRKFLERAEEQVRNYKEVH